MHHLSSGLTGRRIALPNRLSVGNLRALLAHNTFLAASAGLGNSPGAIASVLLDVPAVTYHGIHGQIPNMALNDVVRFFEERVSGRP